MALSLFNFFLLLLSQIGIAFLPLNFSFCCLLFFVFYFFLYRELRIVFLKFCGIYTLSILFFIPLVWIEMQFFEYDFEHTFFLLSLYLKSFLSLCCVILYKRHTSFLEFMSVLEKLHIPPLFLLGTLFILLFLRNVFFMIQNFKTSWKLRIHKPGFGFRIKTFLSLVKNLVVFSFYHLEDLHSMVLLRKLNRPIPFSLLYLSEKEYSMRNKKAI